MDLKDRATVLTDSAKHRLAERHTSTWSARTTA